MSESPCEGIRLHFLLRRKLMFRCHPAGSLDSIFESRCKAKKRTPIRVSFFLCLTNTIDAIIGCGNIICTSVNILQDAAGCTWILPRPKNMPPACFLNGLSNPPSPSKNDTTLSNGVVFWRSSRDSFAFSASQKIIVSMPSSRHRPSCPRQLEFYFRVPL